MTLILSTWHNPESVGKKIPMQDCLDQADLWLYLQGIILITFTEERNCGWQHSLVTVARLENTGHIISPVKCREQWMSEHMLINAHINFLILSQFRIPCLGSPCSLLWCMLSTGRKAKEGPPPTETSKATNQHNLFTLEVECWMSECLRM